MPAPLPRTEWKAHANYPHQTLLLGSHDNFRRIGRSLIDAVDEIGTHADRATRRAGLMTLESVFARWQAAMRSHEHYEESKLFPYLEHVTGASLDALREGHRRIARRRDEVVERFMATLGGAFDGTAELSSALSAFDETLRAHLDLEEDSVIPPLLRMSRSEFLRYQSEPLHRLLEALPDRAAPVTT